MDYITKYYKNKCEVLQEQLEHLQKLHETMVQVQRPRDYSRSEEQRAADATQIGIESGAEYKPGAGPGERLLSPLGHAFIDVPMVVSSLPRFGGEIGKMATAPRILPPVSGNNIGSGAISLQTPYRVISGQRGTPGTLTGKVKGFPIGVGIAHGAGERLDLSSAAKEMAAQTEKLKTVAASETNKIAMQTAPVTFTRNMSTAAIDAANKEAREAVAAASKSVAGNLVRGGFGALSAGTHGTEMAKSLFRGELPTITDTAMTAAGIAASAKPAAAIAPKLVGKAVGTRAAQLVPGLGLVVAAGLMADRAKAGDYLGAGGELASGLLSTVPGVGTLASAGIDAALLSRDVSNASVPPKVELPPELIRKQTKGEIETAERPALGVVSNATKEDKDTAMNPSGAKPSNAGLIDLQYKKKMEQQRQADAEEARRRARQPKI